LDERVFSGALVAPTHSLGVAPTVESQSEELISPGPRLGPERILRGRIDRLRAETPGTAGRKDDPGKSVQTDPGE
jgi:hypothetical protein